MDSVLPILKEVAIDAAGIFAASMALEPVLPEQNNPVLAALTLGAVSEAGTTLGKALFLGQPLPSVVEFADNAISSGAFLWAGNTAGLTDRAYEITGNLGLGGNADVQAALIGGHSQLPACRSAG